MLKYLTIQESEEEQWISGLDIVMEDAYETETDGFYAR
mgnify:CR=1 FL=1